VLVRTMHYKALWLMADAAANLRRGGARRACWSCHWPSSICSLHHSQTDNVGGLTLSDFERPACQLPGPRLGPIFIAIGQLRAQRCLELFRSHRFLGVHRIMRREQDRLELGLAESLRVDVRTGNSTSNSTSTRLCQPVNRLLRSAKHSGSQNEVRPCRQGMQWLE